MWLSLNELALVLAAESGLKRLASLPPARSISSGADRVNPINRACSPRESSRPTTLQLAPYLEDGAARLSLRRATSSRDIHEHRYKA